MLFTSAVPAMAAEAVPEPEARTVSLTVSYVSSDTEEGTKTPISGATFEVTKVADLNWHGGSPEYILADEFSGSGIDFNGMTAAESREAAGMFAQMSVPSGQAVMTDTEGQAVFEDLDQGIYLVEETKKTGTAADYSTADPYLVKVPDYEEGDWIYEVLSSPKSVPVKTVVPVPEQPEETVEVPAVPVKTGDTMDVMRWTGLLLCAIGGLGLLVKAHRRKECKRDD